MIILSLEFCIPTGKNYAQAVDFLPHAGDVTFYFEGKEFIRSMDEICLEMKRIGNNINQLASMKISFVKIRTEGWFIWSWAWE